MILFLHPFSIDSTFRRSTLIYFVLIVDKLGTTYNDPSAIFDFYDFHWACNALDKLRTIHRVARHIINDFDLNLSLFTAHWGYSGSFAHYRIHQIAGKMQYALVRALHFKNCIVCVPSVDKCVRVCFCLSSILSIFTLCPLTHMYMCVGFVCASNRL